jgi:hypothetical protein
MSDHFEDFNDMDIRTQDDAALESLGQHYEQEQHLNKVRAMMRTAIADGTTAFGDLQDDEIKVMTAELIRASDPARIMEILTEPPESGTYPYLIADALSKEWGGHLGLERTADRLLRALLGGTVRYAMESLEEMFWAEVQASKQQQQEARLEAAA